jgi:hypothetical protein
VRVCPIRSLLFLLLAGIQAPLSAQKPPAEHPIITEFRKHIRAPEPQTRADQIERLAKVDSAAAVELVLAHGFKDPATEVRDRAVHALTLFRSSEARAAILAALQSSRAEVREGVASALAAIPDWSPPPVAALIAAFSTERAPEVKVALADALGRSEDPQAAMVLARALAGQPDVVAIAMLDALAMLRAGPATPLVLPHLEHPSWRVQVAALNALSRFRTKEAILPIIDYLERAVGRPQEDARRALVRITQRTFGMDPGQWREWFLRVRDGWQVPPETKDDPEAKEPEGTYARRPVEYHRIPTWSKRILFVIDVSTSMEVSILLKAGLTVGGRPAPDRGTPKIEIAREELAHVLRGFDSETRFNIIAFETDIRFFQKEAIPASPGNVQSALKWLEKQKAWKPSTTVGVASSGVDKDGRILGKTNTYGALRAAYGLSPKRESDSRSVTLGPAGGRELRPPYDTCFLLSDGSPTEGEITDIPSILREVERWNRSARMVVHTIGMEEDQGLNDLLMGIARITGGKCVFLGR